MITSSSAPCGCARAADGITPSIRLGHRCSTRSWCCWAGPNGHLPSARPAAGWTTWHRCDLACELEEIEIVALLLWRLRTARRMGAAGGNASLVQLADAGALQRILRHQRKQRLLSEIFLREVGFRGSPA